MVDSMVVERTGVRELAHQAVVPLMFVMVALL
jgi:hypothetical protein